MNYIKRLESESKQAAAELIGLKAGLSDLVAYLCSPKFHAETWVDVKDVLRRLEEANSLGLRLRDEQAELSNR